jgi:hypothetical protein
MKTANTVVLAAEHLNRALMIVCQALRPIMTPYLSVECRREVSACGLIVETDTHLFCTAGSTVMGPILAIALKASWQIVPQAMASSGLPGRSVASISDSSLSGKRYIN